MTTNASFPRNYCNLKRAAVCMSVAWLWLSAVMAAPLFEQTDVFISRRDGCFAFRMEPTH